MKKLYELCTSETKIWKAFPEGSHNDTVAEAGYFEAVEAFIENKIVDTEEKGFRSANTLPSL
jgi:hypothetical protein